MSSRTSGRRMWSRLIVSSCLPLVLVILTAGPASAQLGKPEGLYYKSWAVVIGIEDYLLAPKMPGAVAQAKAMAQSLRDLGFEQIIELYNKDASAKQLQYVLNDALPRKLGRGDRLVLYFAGQAGQTTDLNGSPLGYLVPWDSPPTGVSKAVTLDQLKEFGRRVMAKHILLLLDTGVSGWDVTPAQQLSLEGRAAPETETDKRVLQVFSSAQYGEAIGFGEGQGAFVSAVTEGLKGGADLNKNGWLMASELAQFVTERVTASSKGTQHPQFARLDGDGDTVLVEGKTSDYVTASEPRTPEEKQRVARTHYEQAFALLQSQQSPADALERLNKAIALDPAFGDAYVLKSFVALEVQPNLPEALAAAQLAVKHAPANPDSHYTLGLVREKQGQHAEAERAFLEAVKTKPDYADVYLSLGLLYEDSLKNGAKAAEAYRRYQELGGTNNRASLFLRQQAAP